LSKIRSVEGGLEKDAWYLDKKEDDSDDVSIVPISILTICF